MLISKTNLELPFDFEKQYFDISVIDAFHLGNERVLVLENFNERCINIIGGVNIVLLFDDFIIHVYLINYICILTISLNERWFER